MTSQTPTYAICGGRVIDPAGGIDGELNIFIEDGVILDVSANGPSSGMKVVDAKGFCVAPGFIDLHAHLREPGFEYKENIESGSNAAAAGGFTTIFCMPNTRPPIDDPQVARNIVERAKSVGLVRIIPIGAMTAGLFGKDPADIAGMAKEGILAISDDGNCIQDAEVMRRVMILAREHGLVVIDHPEDISISGEGVINNGDVAIRLGLKGIPREAENTIIERDIALAIETGARLHLTHLSTAEGVRLVREAKKNGVNVTCDVTPHHLLLTEDEVQELGANAKMKPPLRADEDRLELIMGVRDKTIDAIATDHAPHARREKLDLAGAEFGVIGMETALPACMWLVDEGAITLNRLVELLTIGPARVAGLKAGTLAKGAAADITIFDTNANYRIDATKFKSKARNTPFDGWRAKCRIVSTMVRGRTVFCLARESSVY